MAKKILKLFLLILALLAVIIFAGYKIGLPVFVEKKLEERLKREVSLGGVNLNRLQAIDLHNLVIYEKEGRKKFLQAKEINFSYEFQPLFRSIREKGRRPRDWHLKGEVNSPEIVIKGCQVRNLRLPILLHESVLEVAEFRGDFYQGTLRGSFRLDLSAPRPDWTLSADISRADLNGLVRDLSSKREIEGTLRAEVSLGGGTDVSKLSGQGSVNIDQARLWEIPFLGGLATFLRIPSYEKIVFDQVKGSFSIEGQTIKTKDLCLVSDQVEFFSRGYLIDAEGNIDLMVRVSFSKGFLERIPIVGKIFSFFVDEAGNSIVQVRMYGPPAQIKPKIVPLPMMRSLKEFLEG